MCTQVLSKSGGQYDIRCLVTKKSGAAGGFIEKIAAAKNKNIPKERKEGMYKAILELKSLEECFDFFEDICAMTELRSMEQRFEVASMLKKEKVYTEIMSETNASSATISRVNRMLNYGTGCLGEVIDRLDKKEDKEGTEES